ncbi:MAG: hypothetical protein IBX52_06095 [Bacterioplanes sp.]|nr:hypothetical protein [Bacterioplanes sp.]
MIVSRLTSVVLATAVLLLSSASHAELSANVGLSSEYVRDGISQSRGNITASIGTSYHHQSGVYAGLWGTTLERKNDDTQFELSGFAGWYQPLSQRLAMNIGATRYAFHGNRDSNEQAYHEGFAKVLIDDQWVLGYRRSNDYLGSGLAKSSRELSYTIHQGTFDIEFFTAQHRYLATNSDFNFGGNSRDGYWQFRVAVERTYRHYDYRLAIERTNLGRDFDGGTHFLFGVHRYF